MATFLPPNLGGGIQELVAEALLPVLDRPTRKFSAQSITDDSFDYDNEVPRDPFARMFGSDVGRLAVNIVGNESRTLDIIETVSVDIMLSIVEDDLRMRFPMGMEGVRTLFVPSIGDLPPSLLLLDRRVEASDTRRVTDQFEMPEDRLERLRGTEETPGDEGAVRALVMSHPDHMRTALRIAQPEVVLSHNPRMERLCVPSPCCEVQSASERSTAGIYCRDSGGRLGVTACFHGTGPAGTDVTVAGTPAKVAIANEVQDIVFIPLPEEFVPVLASGIMGVLSGRTPSQYSSAYFEGVTSGYTPTSISSHDAALLRNRPSVQLRVQTPADTNKGDSGTALIDGNGHVIGFAFEKSAYGEIPQITDWIWAANALAAIGVQPI